MLRLIKPYIRYRDVRRQFREVFRTGMFTKGKYVDQFKKDLKDYLKCDYVSLTTSATTSLALCLEVLKIKPDDEVIVSDFSFPATANVVENIGAIPIFADVDLKTYNMMPEDLEKKITSKTKAVIFVDALGNPSNIHEISAICKKHNIPLIEDAACAFSSEFRLSGDIACFSFHARKNLVTGEGGMAITDSDPISDKIRKLSTFGTTSIDGRLIFDDLGYNYKMSDITASVGVTQLKSIDKVTSKKRYLANLWDERLKEISYIEQPYLNSNHVYQSYVTTVDECIDRNKLMNKLRGEDIGCQIGTYASHTQPVYNSSNNCPISYYLYNRSLALPLYYELTEREIDEVYMCLRSI